MRKLFFFIFLFLSFPVFSNDIDILRKEIELLKKKIEKIENERKYLSFNRFSFYGRVFFSLSSSDNYSQLNGKLYNYFRSNDLVGINLDDVRLSFKTNINDNLFFLLTYKFKSSSLYEAYFNYSFSESSNISFGQMLTILSLYKQNTSRSLLFSTEPRYYAIKNFIITNGIGIKFSHHYDYYGLLYGIYGNSYNKSLYDSSVFLINLRNYYNLYKNNYDLLHLGFAYYSAFYSNRFNIAQPNNDTFNSSNDENILYSFKNINSLTFEFALNYGSLNIQSELDFATVKPSSKLYYDRNFNLYNFYFQFNYIFTGEKLKYVNGFFISETDVIRPLNSGGLGAFGMALRFSKSNLQDKNSNLLIDYGIHDIYSFALNWIPSNNSKIIFEYSKFIEKYTSKYIISMMDGSNTNEYDLFMLKIKLFF